MKSLKLMAWAMPMMLVGSAIVYAMAPAGGFAPNATLDPDCAPGDTDCFVTAPLAEPWFGTDDDAEASDNTEVIYHLGGVGIGTSTVETLTGGAVDLAVNNSVLLNQIIFRGGGAPIGLPSHTISSTASNEFRLSNSRGNGSAIDLIPGGIIFNASDANTERMRIDNGTGNVGIGTPAPTSALQVVGLPVHADNAAALAAGLTAGAFYHNGDGVVRVVF